MTQKHGPSFISSRTNLVVRCDTLAWQVMALLLKQKPLTTNALNPNILRTKRKVFNCCLSLHVIIKRPRQQIQGIRDVDFRLEILPHSVIIDEISNRSWRCRLSLRCIVEDQMDNQKALDKHQAPWKFALFKMKLISINAHEVKKALYRGVYYSHLDCLNSLIQPSYFWN